ncbi:MAG: type I-U CRISPR-associated RAMP protein Csb1/Cas7u [Deltaproteobacteria bacterium]
MGELTYEELKAAVAGDGVAFRAVAELQPAGGSGDKVFPPTYEKGQYALEERIIDGQRLKCVLLDSVQSQANRIELALLEAWRNKQLELPVISVNFEAAVPGTGKITSLEAPHRLADAILRDAVQGSTKFGDTEAGKVLATARASNATGLFKWCPTALVLGVWDSTGASGGMGTKFQRAMVSEIVGIDVQTGVKTSSRIDPLGIRADAGPAYQGKDGDWTHDPASAATMKGKPMKVGTDGRPSEVNHGNIPPTLGADAGGVTLTKALQYQVLSLPALRRLQFPVDGRSEPKRDDAGRVALAALALCGATLARAKGLDLRSRCLLVPTSKATWELISGSGEVRAFDIKPATALALLKEAIKAARDAGLEWQSETLELVPSAKLAALVKKSREQDKASPVGD